MTTSWSSSLALIAGLVAALGPAAPTGHAVTDAVLLAVGTGLIVLIGALAPWWVGVVVAAAALAIALDPVLIGVAVVAIALALWNGSRPEPSRVVMAASLGLAFNVLGRAEVGGMLGTSAIVTVRRGRAGLRHRHRAAIDRGAPIGVGRAGRRRAVRGAGHGGLRLRGRQGAPRPRQRADGGRARRRRPRGRPVRGRRRPVPRSHRLPRSGQRAPRQAVGPGRRGRARRRHLPSGGVGHEPRRRRRRDGRRRRPRRDRLRPAAPAGWSLRPAGARRPPGPADAGAQRARRPAADVPGCPLAVARQPGDVRARRLRRERRRAPAGAAERAARPSSWPPRCSASTAPGPTSCCSPPHRRAGRSAGSSGATPS